MKCQEIRRTRSLETWFLVVVLEVTSAIFQFSKLLCTLASWSMNWEGLWTASKVYSSLIKIKKLTRMIQLQKTEIQLNVVITVKRTNLLVILVRGRPVSGVVRSKDLMRTSTVKYPVSYFCLINVFFAAF